MASNGNGSLSRGEFPNEISNSSLKDNSASTNQNEKVNTTNSIQNTGKCINCQNPFLSEDGIIVRQSNTKLFVFKTTQGCFKEVSIISVAEAISYIFGDRFNPKNVGTDSEGSTLNNSTTGELELPLCTRCGDLVQCIYNLHKEFHEMCHADSKFQTLFKEIETGDGNEREGEVSANNYEEGDESDMIVPAVVYGEEEKEDGDEVVFLGNVECDEDEESDSNLNMRRTRKRRRIKPIADPPKRKQKIAPVELPKLPPKKLKPRASLKSILEKLKQKRLISKTAVELAVEKLEWKRRRFENSLHLFRIKKGRKNHCGQESVEKFSKFFQTRPKMRANDIIPTIPCPDCGKTCNKRFLEAHRNVMHRKIPAFKCNICGRINRDFDNLKLHLSTHSRKSTRPVLVKERRTAFCNLCGRTFRKSILDLHIAIHGIPRRFNCKKCDSRFENSRDLKDHQVVHEEGGYYAFKCDSCTQGFKIESFLTQHHLICEMRAVDRPFRCTFCEKRFKLKHHLESHLFEVHRLSKEESRGMVYPGLAKRTVNRKKK